MLGMQTSVSLYGLQEGTVSPWHVMRPLRWACVEWVTIQTLQPQTLSHCETVHFSLTVASGKGKKCVSIDFGVICVNGSWQ